MAEIVKLEACAGDQEAVVALLEEALEKARSGVVIDVAVVMAIRDEDGPSFCSAYHGEAAYAMLLAGVSALEFELHHDRYAQAGRT